MIPCTLNGNTTQYKRYGKAQVALPYWYTIYLLQSEYERFLYLHVPQHKSPQLPTVSPFTLHHSTGNCTPRRSTWPLRLVCVRVCRAFLVLLISQPSFITSSACVLYLVQFTDYEVPIVCIVHGTLYKLTPPSSFIASLWPSTLTLGRLHDCANTQWDDQTRNGMVSFLKCLHFNSYHEIFSSCHRHRHRYHVQWYISL